MHKILHRINSVELLKKIPMNFGVEIDIRSNRDNLILHHDPFEEGELFEDWLKFFDHGTLILNVKEGVEDMLINDNLTAGIMKKTEILIISVVLILMSVVPVVAFDFSDWDALIKKHVSPKKIDGVMINAVNYKNLKNDENLKKIILK